MAYKIANKKRTANDMENDSLCIRIVANVSMLKAADLAERGGGGASERERERERVEEGNLTD